jgi:hypothetical protein
VRLRLVFVLLALAAPNAAYAGRTFYGWLYGTEVMPERGVEALSWLSEQNDQDLGNMQHYYETRWGVAPLVGINDQLELALPIEMVWADTETFDPATNTTTRRPFSALDRYGAELRYRFVTQDPVDAPPLVPLIRVAVDRLVLARAVWNPQLDLVTSYEVGRVHALVDVGAYSELSSGAQTFELHPGAGFSILAVDGLRFGGEIHAEITLTSGGGSWAVAGPNMSWSHGRFWLSAAYGIGIYHIGDAPRVQWGIAF